MHKKSLIYFYLTVAVTLIVANSSNNFVDLIKYSGHNDATKLIETVSVIKHSRNRRSYRKRRRRNRKIRSNIMSFIPAEGKEGGDEMDKAIF